jgi:hypothetical protein
MPFPCRSAKGLDSVFPIWFTQCGRVWLPHAMPFPCQATNMPFWNRPLTATAGERHGMCELASAVQRRHVGDLPAFGTDRVWKSRGRGTAWERHGMCESALTLSQNRCPPCAACFVVGIRVTKAATNLSQGSQIPPRDRIIKWLYLTPPQWHLAP